MNLLSFASMGEARRAHHQLTQKVDRLTHSNKQMRELLTQILERVSVNDPAAWYPTEEELRRLKLLTGGICHGQREVGENSC